MAERLHAAVAAMPFVIGTAGHIDHGKTSLIKALTGQDTDRLKEEKARGISIDLGFAHVDLSDGTRAGIVDVPGHERFIRNMLAGAHGIDLVLFTVAADDGVMPQTVEHLDILHLLGLTRAIVVITKIDLVPAARVAEVAEEIEILTTGTSLARSPVVPCSPVTGEGLDRLRAGIEDALRRAPDAAPSGYFRLPVDRVFVLAGHGVVVTGTALEGEVRAGGHVRALPGGQVFRVRSLQVHGQAMPSARAGQRVALNLTGAEKPDITRGDAICDEHITLTSTRFDGSLEVRPSAAAGIKSHQRVRVHLGTAERLGKIVVLGSGALTAAGQTGFCQIVVGDPLVARRGDRFVIRDETARHTLGGGIVLDPWSRPHRRREPGLAQTLETLRAGDPAAVAALFVDGHEDFAVTLDLVHQFLGATADEARRLLHEAPGVVAIAVDADEVYTSSAKWDASAQALVGALRAFHAAHPLLPGRDMEELRDRLPGRQGARLFRAFVERLAAEGTIVREGSLLRLPTHAVVLKDDEQRLVERLVALLAATPLSPPDLKEIERETGIARTTLTGILRVLERGGSVVRAGNDIYFLASAVDGVTRVLREELADRTDITPAMVRDRFGTTRKYTVPLLEYLDTAGVTSRIGDKRRVRTWQTSSNAEK